MARPREFDEEAVVQRAMEVFWVNGYRCTTPQILLDATGLSKSSLYATFKSKKGLFLSVLQKYAQLNAAHLRATLYSGTLREGMESLYEMLVTNATSGRTCLLCSSAIEAPVDDAEITALLDSAQTQTENVFYERLLQAQQDGELDKGRDARGLARLIVSTNTGLMILARNNPNPEWVRPIATEMLSALL